MEDLTILALVLGSNAIMLAGNYLMVKKQIKHSSDQLEKQLEAKREEDRRKRKWEVRDGTLVKLRDELARMAEKLEWSVDLATQASDEVKAGSDKIKIEKDLKKAVEEWDSYITSGAFHEALHMQHEHNLKVEAHDIFSDYQSAFVRIREFWRGEKGEEAIDEAKAVLGRNASRVSSVQLEIIKLREGL